MFVGGHLYDELEEGLPPGEAPVGWRGPYGEGGLCLGLEAGGRGAGAQARPVHLLEVRPQLHQPGTGTTALRQNGGSETYLRFVSTTSDYNSVT